MTEGSASAPAPVLTLGDVVRAALPDFTKTHRLPVHHWKALRAIAVCRTPALGGHQFRCEACGKDHFAPHSCRNRHCPTCQGSNGAEWLEKQAEHLLPIPYFHVVFTLPHVLNPLIQHNQRQLYNLLFSAASKTLLEFGANNLKANLGITAVLHTWGQTQCGHYHLHCVVTGGGLSLDGTRWVSVGEKWLFPVPALSTVFRAKFRDGLRELFDDGDLILPKAEQSLADPPTFTVWLDQICRKPWVVYAKKPFAGPEVVLAYLCRYTHRVGITNRRLKALDLQAQTVTFDYKDYSAGGVHKLMTLSLDDFLSRFCLHILPPHFVKIRHYGLVANRDRDARIAKARQLLETHPELQLASSPLAKQITPVHDSALKCPHCGQPKLVLVAIIGPSRSSGIEPRPAIIDTS